MFSVNFSGVFSKLDLEMEKILIKAEQAMNDMILLLRLHFAEPKTGRFHWFKSPSGWKKYQASAPEEYPAIKLGKLSDSLTVEAEIVNGVILAKVYTTNVKYSRELETTMKRPFISRVMKENQALIIDIIHQGR